VFDRSFLTNGTNEYYLSWTVPTKSAGTIVREFFLLLLFSFPFFLSFSLLSLLPPLLLLSFSISILLLPSSHALFSSVQVTPVTVNLEVSPTQFAIPPHGHKIKLWMIIVAAVSGVLVLLAIVLVGVLVVRRTSQGEELDPLLRK
jgi:hypothetical protein